MKVQFALNLLRIKEWLGSDLANLLVSKVEFMCFTTTNKDGDLGSIPVYLIKPSCVVKLDKYLESIHELNPKVTFQKTPL